MGYSLRIHPYNFVSAAGTSDNLTATSVFSFGTLKKPLSFVLFSCCMFSHLDSAYLAVPSISPVYYSFIISANKFGKCSTNSTKFDKGSETSKTLSSSMFYENEKIVQGGDLIKLQCEPKYSINSHGN